MAKTQLVFSFDYDGCLAQEGFDGFNGQPEPGGYGEIPYVILQNGALCETISTILDGKEHPATVLIGSNRNSLLDDYNNATKNPDQQMRYSGSAFYHIPKIAEYYDGWTFDPFLMANLYNSGTPTDIAQGEKIVYEAYQQGVDRQVQQRRIVQNANAGGWIQDKTKISLVFAQLQHIAVEKKPTKENPIDFYFFDDKADILQELRDFFNENPHAIPEHMNLQLWQYASDHNEAFGQPIKGTGSINHQYEHTVKAFAHQLLAEASAAGTLYSITGEEITLQQVQELHYNTGFIIEKKHYTTHSFLPAQVHADSPLLNFLASNGLMGLATLILLGAIGTTLAAVCSFTGLFAGLSGTAALITLGVGSGAVVGSGATLLAGFWAKGRLDEIEESLVMAPGL